MSQYVTSAGDTLDSISRKTGADVAVIMAANADTIMSLLAQAMVFPQNTELEVPDSGAPSAADLASAARVTAWEAAQNQA